jgi:hypothetical protein
MLIAPTQALRRILFLATAAAFFTAIALQGLSWIFSLLAMLLILGTILSMWYRRAGQWTMLISAVLPSVLVLPIFMVNVREFVRAPFHGPHDFGFLVTISWWVSPVLLVWCITAVVISLRRGLT